MSRTPYAAKTLLRQIGDKRKYDVEFGEPDGLGVIRSLRFDKRTSKWLAPLLEAIKDPRIHEARVTDAGYLHVEFVSTPRADDRAKFPLDAAKEVTAQRASAEETAPPEE